VSNTPFFEFYSQHVKNLKHTGSGQWMGLCPFHDDTRPSLSIEPAEGLFNCFGCGAKGNARQFAERLGISPPESGLNKEPEAVYDYRDEKGRLLFQAVRFPGKDFKQRQPNGNGSWVWNLRGVRRVLYRLNELQGRKTVYAVEGEKDADRLWSLGIPATTSPGGAENWRDEYTEQLKAAGIERVVILPDNDEPGRRHAAQVSWACHQAGLEVKIVPLPGITDGGDVCDWLAAGGERKELERLAAEAPVWTPPAGAAILDGDGGSPRPLTEAVAVPLSHVQREDVEWLWPNWVPKGRLTLIAGDPGAGKSWLTQAIAAAVSTGTPLPGMTEHRDPAGVLLVALEDDAGDTVRPRVEDMGGDLGRVHVYTHVREVDERGAEQGRGLVFPQDADLLQALIARTEAELVVLDPLVAVQDARIDSHRQAAMRSILQPLHGVAKATGAAILVVSHLRKSAAETTIYRPMGSIDLVAISRTAIAVGRDPDNPQRRAAAVLKSNLGPFPVPVAFTLHDGQFLWDAAPAADLTADKLLGPPPGSEEGSALDEAKDFLIEALAGGPKPVKEVQKAARAAGIAERTLARTKARMGVRAKRCGVPGGKRGEGEWLWALPEAEEPEGALVNDQGWKPAALPPSTGLGTLNREGEQLGITGTSSHGLRMTRSTINREAQTPEIPRDSRQRLRAPTSVLSGDGHQGRQQGSLERTIPEAVAVEIRRIEPEALALGWTHEELWQSVGWYSARGLAGVMPDEATVEQVAADVLTLRLKDGRQMRFRRKARVNRPPTT